MKRLQGLHSVITHRLPPLPAVRSAYDGIAVSRLCPDSSFFLRHYCDLPTKAAGKLPEERLCPFPDIVYLGDYRNLLTDGTSMTSSSNFRYIECTVKADACVTAWPKYVRRTILESLKLDSSI